MHWATASGVRSRRTPAASSTSAEPLALVMPRLPCLATRAPPSAATKADAVETLNSLCPVPPVPQVSIRSSKGVRTVVARDRMASAAPEISATVSPRWRSAIRTAAIWASLASPPMMASMRSRAPSWVRVSPLARRSRSPVREWLINLASLPGSSPEGFCPPVRRLTRDETALPLRAGCDGVAP